jgi:DNA-binding transcriptional LysR family regulator
MNIKDIDLNLLSALDVLLECQSVSQAAKKLNITQPAMSNALARMRNVFGDELLVRSGREMLLTPRAEKIRGRLRNSLQKIETEVLNTLAFDAATCEQVFSLALHDYEQLLILPHLEHIWGQNYPGLTIGCRTPISSLSIAELKAGVLDFATGPEMVADEGIHHQKMLTDRFVCMVSNNHGFGKRKLTVQAYAEMEHIFLSPHGALHGEADKVLQQLGRTRRVKYALPQFSLVPWMLRNSSLVATLPERIARQFAEVFPLKIIDCPIELGEFSIYLLWHDRIHTSPAHNWLRGQVLSLFPNPDK